MLSAPPPQLPRRAVFLHLAGAVSGPGADPALNPALASALVKACGQYDAASILFASTVALYAPGPIPARENDPPAPVGDYGRSKLAAEQVLQMQSTCPVTLLRIGNVAGADALLGPRQSQTEIILDPVRGRRGGPIRSWIGPHALAQVLARLCTMDRPDILNIALDPPLAMADLLDASNLPWRYGPENSRVVPCATVSTTLLESLISLPGATPETLAADAAWAREVLT